MIYKITKNRMPDENSTQVGDTQTSQNDQTVQNQIGNDFSLDFGDGGLEQIKNTEEVNIQEFNTESEGKSEDQNPVEMKLDLDQNVDIDSTEGNGNDESVNTNNLDDEENLLDNDFDISLDRDNSLENQELDTSIDDSNESNSSVDNEIIDKSSSEDINSQEMSGSDNDFTISLDKDTGDTMDENINNEEKVEDDENISENSMGDLDIESENTISEEYVVDDNDREDSEPLNSDEKTFEKDDFQGKNMEIVNESSSEMIGDENLEIKSDNDETVDDSIQENASKFVEMFGDNSEGEKHEDLELEEKQEENVDFVTDYNPEDGETQNEEDLDSSSETDEDNNTSLEDNIVEEENNLSYNITENTVDDSNVLFDNDSNNLSKVEIEESVEESVDKLSSNENMRQTEPSENINIEGTVNTLENVDTTENVIATENIGMVENIKTEEEINTTLDSNVEGNSKVISQAETVNNSIEEAKLVATNEVSNENMNKSDSQEVLSTLSLDQILDSELTSNLQSIDNERESSEKVSNNVGIFSNKKVTILAGVGLFLLVGFVAVLAFPSKSSERQEWEVVQTGDTTKIEDPTVEIDDSTGHSAAPEDPVNDPVLTTGSVAGSTIDFPDPDWEAPKEDPTGENPIPYVCNDDSCLEEPEEPVEIEDTLTLGDIMPTISEFRSQAEKYSSQGYKLEDKQLIKYATQAIHLCDVYQTQVEGGEGVDQESFDSYVTKIKSLMSKIERYVDGNDEIQTFIQSDFNEEYGHEGKQEYLDYIYNRDSSTL